MLELQARLLRPASLPRLAAEGIAAGHHGDTLYTLANLVGERQAHVLAVVATIPNVEERVVDELGVPRRSPDEAVWELARLLARATAAGEMGTFEGACELTSLARAADNAQLIREATPLEAMLEEWEHIPAAERDSRVLTEARRLAVVGGGDPT